MATRFYFNSTTAPSVSPGFNANWEQTGEAVRRRLESRATNGINGTAATNLTVTVPITTTQDILAYQFISDPVGGIVNLGGIMYGVIRCTESATTANAHIAYALRKLDIDGTTLTEIASAFATSTEFPTATATRLFGNGVSTLAIANTVRLNPGERLILELGVRASAPTAATTATLRSGTAAATDYAFTSGLTTDLNPWVEFSTDFYQPTMLNNYQQVSVGNGMSATESILRR